ncbi:Piggybac transposable element-derived protein 4-like protein [Elysia marginata]|uniref:Piggybac transposable element-derived protein 4-like protein n=1 Tax=Elysia marginata TaxID=1093978 RepID=A0AAV4H1B5_9GAST|nr:Piggybac transposable element-derived protein 4-like protein [Elysia marginata]
MSDEEEFVPYSSDSDGYSGSDDSHSDALSVDPDLNTSIAEEVVDGTVIRTVVYMGKDGTEWKNTPRVPNAQTRWPNVVTLPRNRANLTMDEQLIPFRGLCPIIQYIPSKPAKYGLKLLWICDSENYYPLKCIVYTGHCDWKDNKKGTSKCNKCHNFLCKDHIGQTLVICKKCLD